MAKVRQISGAEVRYESHRKRRRPARPKMQPPLTPMIDVTFQLLLYFLIAATFRNEGNIPSSLPKGQDSGPGKVQPVFVIIRQDGVGAESRPVYFVKVGQGQEEPVPVSEGLSLENYRAQAALALHDELLRIKGTSDPDIPLVIKPQADYSRAGPGQYPYVRWMYVVDAFNQAMRCEFKEIGFAPPEGAS